MEIRITKKLLNNYRKYKRELPWLQAELEEMQHGDAGIGNSTIFDYSTGFPLPQSVVGFDWALYEHRKGVIERRQAQITAVENWISGIDDGQTRCIFRMRYIDGMSWVKIAEKTGYAGNPDYPRIVIRDRYLEKCGIK
ncbi:MAG: hypothetical protein KH452_06020 [Clostridiales bacterium]|nr:hypothetical protein [Clostridiales bacterium]